MSTKIHSSHGSWSIGIDQDNYSIVVSTTNYPTGLKLTLYEPSSESLKKIATLFLETAELWESKRKVLELERKLNATKQEK